MKRLILAVLLFLCASPAWAWTEVKFNFRSSSAYVTDGAGETRVVSPAEVNTGPAETYTGSAIRDGLTFGWESPATSVDTRDRNNTAGRERFAGFHFNGGDNQDTFRVDGLTAGCTYEVRLAAGDPSNALATVYFQLFDNTTQFGSTINSSTSTFDAYLDATGVERTPANYDANNVAVTRVFVNTVFKIKIGNNAALNTGALTHLHIKQTSCPAAGGEFYGRRRAQ